MAAVVQAAAVLVQGFVLDFVLDFVRAAESPAPALLAELPEAGPAVRAVARAPLVSEV